MYSRCKHVVDSAITGILWPFKCIRDSYKTCWASDSGEHTKGYQLLMHTCYLLTSPVASPFAFLIQNLASKFHPFRFLVTSKPYTIGLKFGSDIIVAPQVEMTISTVISIGLNGYERYSEKLLLLGAIVGNDITSLFRALNNIARFSLLSQDLQRTVDVADIDVNNLEASQKSICLANIYVRMYYAQRILSMLVAYGLFGISFANNKYLSYGGACCSATLILSNLLLDFGYAVQLQHIQTNYLQVINRQTREEGVSEATEEAVSVREETPQQERRVGVAVGSDSLSFGGSSTGSVRSSPETVPDINQHSFFGGSNVINTTRKSSLSGEGSNHEEQDDVVSTSYYIELARQMLAVTRQGRFVSSRNEVDVGEKLNINAEEMRKLLEYFTADSSVDIKEPIHLNSSISSDWLNRFTSSSHNVLLPVIVDIDRDNNYHWSMIYMQLETGRNTVLYFDSFFCTDIPGELKEELCLKRNINEFKIVDNKIYNGYYSAFSAIEFARFVLRSNADINFPSEEINSKNLTLIADEYQTVLSKSEELQGSDISLRD